MALNGRRTGLDRRTLGPSSSSIVHYDLSDRLIDLPSGLCLTVGIEREGMYVWLFPRLLREILCVCEGREANSLKFGGRSIRIWSG